MLLALQALRWLCREGLKLTWGVNGSTASGSGTI